MTQQKMVPNISTTPKAPPPSGHVTCRPEFSIWAERWRPVKVINDVILPRTLKKLFATMIVEKEIQNMLFYSSSPGVGKTTVAKAIVNDIGAEHLYINTSKDNGIDTLRHKIDKFATSMSPFGDNKKKVIILDEFDGATRPLQDALRASIEEYQNFCRFIITCNYITKIIKPIKSRCECIDFNFADKETSKEMIPKITKRLKGILSCERINGEKIPFDGDVVQKIVETYYPDMRKMLQLLQQYTKQSGVVDDGIFKTEVISDELTDYILNKKLTKARTFVIQMNYDYLELYNFLYDELVPKIQPMPAQAEAITIVAEYMWRESQGVLNSEINFAACLIEVMRIL